MSNKISRRQFLRTSAAAATGAALMAGPAKPALSQSKVITWKGQSCFTFSGAPFGPFGPKLTGVGGGCWMWTEWLKKASGGRLLIDWSEPGAIVPNAEVDTAVSKNVVQIAYTFAAYYGGRVPESDIETGGVFLWEDIDQFFECLYKYGFYQAMQKVYDKYNIKYIPFPTNAIQGAGTTFPAPNPQSFKGKKVRALGMWGDYVRMMGGSPVPLPWGEIYMGMKLGTIDAWCGGSGALEELKLKEVTTGYIDAPSMSLANANLLINKDAFKALPPDLQAILDRDAAYVAYACSSNWRNQCNWTLKHAMVKYNVKTYQWSQEDVNKTIQQSFQEVYPRIAKKSKGCEELIEIVKKQMKDYGRIK